MRPGRLSSPSREVRPGDLLADEALAAGTLPALYVTALAEAPRGAWPLGLAGRYEPDQDHLAEYARFAVSEEGFAAYCAAHVTGGTTDETAGLIAAE